MNAFTRVTASLLINACTYENFKNTRFRMYIFDKKLLKNVLRTDNSEEN